MFCQCGFEIRRGGLVKHIKSYEHKTFKNRQDIDKKLVSLNRPKLEEDYSTTAGNQRKKAYQIKPVK